MYCCPPHTHLPIDPHCCNGGCNRTQIMLTHHHPPGGTPNSNGIDRLCVSTSKFGRIVNVKSI